MSYKELYWCGSALADLRQFTATARRIVGFELYLVQTGAKPSDSRPMKTVGPGVAEIRISDRRQAFRVLYVAKFEEAVYVLHAFRKKTQQTRHEDIAIARRRLKAVVSARKKR